jgi:16S rRNA (cytosine967-C5)-methyltransferase
VVAYQVLRAVAERDLYANLELARALRAAGLSGRDAAFATELVTGTLRLRRAYDAVLDQLVDRPLDAPVRDALRLGVHQLLGMRVPTHAAVGTTVDVVKSEIGFRPSGLVNAVLRKAGESSLEEWLADAPLAVRTSHPDWVVELLAEALDRPAELEPLLEADNARPQVTLAARPGLSTREELGGTLVDISPLAVVLPGGDPGDVAAVAEGRAGVQDAGSQLVALAAVRAGIEGPDQRWLDLCAGPGGKAALMGAVAALQGARLLANELAPHRSRLVAQSVRAARAGLAGVVCGDGTAPPWRPATFVRVLLDAPCSGLGALRRRPEARWRKSPNDLVELTALQADLLDAAVAALAPGGVLAYVTCSPHPDETRAQVRRALERHPALRTLDTPAVLERVARAPLNLPDAPSAQLWPHRHGTDAMFIQLLTTLEG